MATNFNTVVSSSASNSQITTQGNDALITKAYADANYSGGGGGTAEISIAQYTSTDTTTNVNSASFTVIPFNSTDSITDTGNFSISSGRVTISEVGKYLVTGHISYENAVTRGNVGVAIFKNGSTLGFQGNMGYLRNNTGHLEASAIVQAYVDVTSVNDIIDIRGIQMAATGTINLRSGESVFSIQKISGVLTPTGVSANSSTSTTENVDLSDVAGTYYTALRESGTITVASGAVTGGFAHLRISYSGEPTVSGATKMAGADFVASTEMKMVFYNDGFASYYYFLEI